MKDEAKTKRQLIHELTAMRQRVTELEAAVTKCQQAEEMLAKERNLLRTVVDNLPDLIYVKDSESRTVLVNAACLRLSGLTQMAELIGKTDFDFFPEELAAQFYADEQTVICSGQPLIGREELHIDVTGQHRWFLTNKVPLWSDQGKVVGIVGLSRDITERKWVEAELRQYKEHLEEQVSARTVEFTKTNEQLQREITERRRVEEALRQYTVELQTRNEELDAFAHTVAHDLQNPLTRIVGFAEVLAECYADLSVEEVGEYLPAMARDGRKASNIVHELLLLASVRKQEVQVKPLDMGRIVAEARQRWDSLIEEYQVEITLPSIWPVALGYGPWIEEVWTNYLSNGIKYGGRPPQLELGATTQTDGSVRFWVRDNGPGLTPQEQAQLFTEFTQLHQVRVKGHGLGLSIVRSIVEKLGGQVGVESEGLPGRGSVFSFTLPGVRE